MVLKVYVAECCYVCKNTPKIIEEIHEKFPELDVEVIDIEKSDESKIPDSIFSVATFALNGRTISLGNPSSYFISKLRDMVSSI